MLPYQSQFFAHRITLEGVSDDSFAKSPSTARVEMNPHQVDAALFALQPPIPKGAILADEVGLGKTIEASLVIAQRCAEHKRRILLIVPASLRKQWTQELFEKFGLRSLILEAKNYREQLIDRAVAESDQGAGTRLHPRDQQTRHPPGGVIVDADVGRLDAGARGDDLDNRQPPGVHAPQRIADERVIGNGEDQASPTEARIADMCGDRGCVILVHEGAVQRDRSVERFGDPGKSFRQAREERGLWTHEDHLDPRQTPMRRRQTRG